MPRVVDLEEERRRQGSGDYYPRYSLTFLHTSETSRRVRYGIWNRPKISTKDARFHVTREVDLGRLDNLSLQYLGDPRYWWVIAVTNGIHNQLRDMEVGVTLTIPTTENVISALANANQNEFF